MTARPPSGAGGVSEPAPSWRPQATPGAEAADGTATESTSPSGQEGVVPRSPGRSPGKIAAEAQGARTDFHRAASRTGAGAKAPGRSAALQAFFVANAGRGLLPSGENSGVLSPNLKTEES